ncbi:MAG: alpha/beta hydrolase [Actinomycetota bacterium]|nr:alpha/beta hydrolase [Actinomycetota bacterium]
MPYAEVNGQRIWFEDSGGAGPAVLFSHGFLMDADMFAPQVEALAGEFRCIAWDERAFGRTEHDGKPFTYWDSAADALGLLDHLGVTSAVLAGMSQGGFLSLRAALHAPERVRALVLIDTQAGVEDPQAIPGYQAMVADWEANGPKNVGDIVADLIIGDPDASRPWLAKWEDYPGSRLRVAFDCLVGRDDVTARLGEIGCPALVVHGTADESIDMASAETLCSGLADCRDLVRVDGAAHASNLTHATVVNPAIREFLLSLA